MQDTSQKDSSYSWDIIADSFDTTRKKPWNQCLDFILSLPKQTMVADLGCGNGRHLLPLASQCTQAIGIDKSANLLGIVQQKIKQNHLKNIVLLQGDLICNPLKDNSVDAVLYIAALHNIKGREHRIQSLKEVNRILKPGGKTLISVWSRWQDNYWTYFVKKIFSQNETEEFGDITIYWKQHGLNVARFYHLYSKNEFVADIEKSGLRIDQFQCVKLRSTTFPDNFFIQARKPNKDFK